jgi:hypothetical protein
MRQFRGFGDQRHHHQIRANDGHMLEPKASSCGQGGFSSSP